MNKAVISGLVVLMLAAVPVFAATIDVGDHFLLPDTAGQTIEISITPGDPVEKVAGMNLFAQIADGGPEVGGSVDGPVFTDADLLTGTIFGGDPLAAPIDIPVPQVLVGAIALATSGTTIDADGLLVTLEVDTTGFNIGDGPWELKLANTLDPAGTQMLDGSVPSPQVIPVTIINGTIYVPEPSTIVMLLGVLAAFGLLAWRKR